jgi:nitrate reductase NapE component
VKQVVVERHPHVGEASKSLSPDKVARRFNEWIRCRSSETDARTAEQSSARHAGSSALQLFAAVAFFSVAGAAMVGWIGFLVWIGSVLLGF